MSTWPGPASWWLVVAGWSAVAVLWHTSVLAIAVAAWQHGYPAASARARHAIAATALAVAVALTLATPAFLAWQPFAPALAEPPGGPLAAAGELGTDRPAIAAGTAPGRQRAPVSSLVHGAAASIGAVWSLGIVIGLVRLTGGWLLARRIRRDATAFRTPDVMAVLREVPAFACEPPPTLLESRHVDAPVVVGAIAPAILLPASVDRLLPPDALQALIAHELAHVRRRDYAANLAQSVADVLLWFSPGARFVSCRLREAREYCCDDAATSQCDRRTYIGALTALAGVPVQARAAVGAVGPPLVARIRRLLQEDTMASRSWPRLVGFGAALVVAMAAGGRLVAVCGSGVASAAGGATHAEELVVVRPGAQVPSVVPIGWVASQRGSSVELRRVVATDAGACGIATVHNGADVAVTGVAFAAVPHDARVHPSAALHSSVTSGLLALSVPAGGTVTLALNLLPPGEWRARFPPGRFQAMCAITAVRYANGESWGQPPAVAFARTYPEVSRGFLNRDSSGSPHFCRDEQGATYSLGALIRIAREPGRRARCEAGAWVEHGATQTRPAAPPRVRLDFIMPNGARPSMAVEAGKTARLDIGTRSWGFTPTFDTSDGRRVRLEVLDYAVAPPAQVTDVFLDVGDEPVEIPAVGVTLQVRLAPAP